MSLKLQLNQVWLNTELSVFWYVFLSEIVLSLSFRR